MLSQESIEKILGIEPGTDLTPEAMASKLVLTVFPYDLKTISRPVFEYFEKFQAALRELGVTFIPYDEALITIPIRKVLKRFFRIIFNNLFFAVFEIFGIEHGYYHVHSGALLNLLKRRRVKRGVSIIVLGENQTSHLPIDYSSSFTNNTIVTILDIPNGIGRGSDFEKHFDTAMNTFSYHMTHLAIMVDENNWLLYNFNASHPIYPIDSNLKTNLLKSLIPKISAPIKPPLLKDFILEKDGFDTKAEPYKSIIGDFIKGGQLFRETKLYPSGKKVDGLPFRNGFYRWIGKIHLDHRSGMSYGFLAYQLPVSTPQVISLDKFIQAHEGLSETSDCFVIDNHLHVALNFLGKRVVLRVPDVWVLTQRSGSDKTNIDPVSDLLLLGLKDGKMYIKTARGARLRRDYKPSFDTKVILAHAVGNAMIAALMRSLPDYDETKYAFVDRLSTKGAAIVHWHGYIRKDMIPNGWFVHGNSNPHVACSTAQSAIYALSGKIPSFYSSLVQGIPTYQGDVHIEPHHGTNITFTSISDLASFLLKNPQASRLGNAYLDQQ